MEDFVSAFKRAEDDRGGPAAVPLMSRGAATLLAPRLPLRGAPDMEQPTPSAPRETPAPAGYAPIPALFHLTGSRRGTTETLVEDTVRIGTAPDTEIHLPADREPEVAAHHATLHRRGQTYRLRVEPGQRAWVNGEPVAEMVLASGDVLRIGDDGPRLRFRVYQRGHPLYRSMAEVLEDCVDCAQIESSSAIGRAAIFFKMAPIGIATGTSPRFRGSLLLILLLASTAALAVRSLKLEQRLESQQTRVGGIAQLLEKTESEALTLEDLGAVRTEIERRLSGTVERLQVLEERAGAGRRVISTAAESIVFLQGSYGFLDRDSRKPLRFMVGPAGGPVLDPTGSPAVTTEGEGPVLESQFTGTGFVATGDGLILTNRHVAVPWDFDEAAKRVVQHGLIPSFFRFQGYLEGIAEPFDVELVATSDDADVAVLKCSLVTSRVRPLPLAETPPEPGDEVIVLGYPTGIRALLARTDVDFVNQLMAGGDLDFWKVARRLSEAGHIAPLATRGFVGQVTPAAVVYDAETTSGGSGGPVINLDGEVVAVNMAILPEFGGSNLGVPIAKARALLESPPAPQGSEFTPAVEFPKP